MAETIKGQIVEPIKKHIQSGKPLASKDVETIMRLVEVFGTKKFHVDHVEAIAKEIDALFEPAETVGLALGQRLASEAS